MLCSDCKQEEQCDAYVLCIRAFSWVPHLLTLFTEGRFMVLGCFDDIFLPVPPCLC